MKGQWTIEKAWEWYENKPWIRGCNFMGSDVVNAVDMWQELGFEHKLKTAKRELQLAAETGYNAVRLILNYVVWKEQRDGFLDRFDQFLDVLYSFGIQAMVVFGNDCQVPRDNPYSQLRCGEQKYDWGYHGGRKKSQHSTTNSEPGYWLIDDEPEQVYAWVREVMEKHKNDSRILIWDLYNEPGNCRRDELTVPHIKRFYEIARDVNPMQPITSAVWRLNEEDEPLSEVEQYVLDHSDIISYHSYSSYLVNVQIIRKLKQYGRPMINSEWLGRILHNTVQKMFPLFYVERIGCFNWGFVAGKYQTYEPWEASWEQYYSGEQPDIDFTKWFHDLYRPNLRPYDPKEIELIQTLTKVSDKEFEQKSW